MDSNSFTPETGRQAPPRSGRPNPRTENFKVSIDEFNQVPDEYVPIQRPSAYAPTKKPTRENFEVNIPKRKLAPENQSRQKRPVSKNASRSAKSKTGAKRRSASSQKRSSGSSKRRVPESELTPAQRARLKEQRKFRRTKGAIIACICAVIITIITATASSLALGTIKDILVLSKDETAATVSVIIPEGSDFNDVYDILCDNGLVHQKFITKLFCKFRHYDKAKNREGKYVNIEYVPGAYYLEPDSGIEVMLENIKKSNSVSKDTVRLTFPEGWTIAQVFEKIEKYNVCTAEKLYANLDIVGKQFGFYKNIPSNTGRYLKAEGYIFPDTYDFYIGENANSVLKKLFTNFTKKWTKEYTQKAKALRMSQDQIIILASIIQREAKNASQMADISSVLHNRLDDPATYPQLQMNSTKDYITSVNKYGLFSDFYYSIYLDAYNTYSAEGLPPGAICNPGIEAIEAALNPSDTNYHFFCHDDNGNIYLAETAAEHQKNTEKIFYESD